MTLAQASSPAPPPQVKPDVAGSYEARFGRLLAQLKTAVFECFDNLLV